MEKEAYSKLEMIEENHWWFRARKEMLSDILKGSLRMDSQPKILDVGASVGGNLKNLSAGSYSVGIDLSTEAVRFCFEKGLKVIQADANYLPFKRESFDVVLALDLLEHLEDEESFIKESIRVLKTGGLLIIFVPAFSFLRGRMDIAALHIRRYTQKSLLKILNSPGLGKIRISYFNFLLFPIILLFRFVTKLFNFSKNNYLELSLPPKPLNEMLFNIFNSEVKFSKIINYPFGASIYYLGVKNEFQP